MFINKPFFEVVYDDTLINRNYPYTVVRNFFPDTIWVLSTDFDKDLSPLLIASAMQSYKDTVQNTEDFFKEEMPDEKLTAVCPGNSVKFNSYCITKEEFRFYKDNRIYYEFPFFTRTSQHYLFLSERTLYKVDSNNITVFYHAIDSSRGNIAANK